jgi:hypothetical protein
MRPKYGTCRSCGTKLLRSEYARFARIDTERESQATGLPHDDDHAQYYDWIHRPCPQCNEPRPLQRKWRGWAIVIGFVLVFALGIWAEFG